MEKNKKFEINAEECSDLAYEIFMATSGLSKEGKKFERMKRDAFCIRKAINDNVKIQCIYNYYDNIEINNNIAVIGSQIFRCTAFELINPETIKGAYVYAISAGNFIMPEEKIMNQLYADIWGTAFADSARMLLKQKFEIQSIISDSFGPGFYGMDVSEMLKIAELIDLGEIGVELRNSCILVPVKSCAGIYFDVDENYTKLKSECADCRGTHSNCKLCQIGGGE